MNDPLAAFRKKPAGAVEQPQPKAVENGYVAFETKDHVASLQILRAKYPGHMPPYNLLINVIFSGEDITQIVLVFSFMMIFIKGKNLKSLLTAFKLRTVDVIREFDPSKWRKPTDPKETIIESIEVKFGEKGPGISESEKWCSTESGQSIH
jgi:hypothetical protein